jgi:hypothetical protein
LLDKVSSWSLLTIQRLDLPRRTNRVCILRKETNQIHNSRRIQISCFLRTKDATRCCGVNRPTIARSLSTLSFFSFLNLCSRNRDLDENDAQGTQQRLEPAGFQNGFLRSKLQQRRKTPRQGSRLVAYLRQDKKHMDTFIRYTFRFLHFLC